jgi:glycosyltransferase involved in cell wall biosynthesis
MRLLFVSDHYPPFVGGAERQTYLLATRFAAAGHDVAVAVPWVNGLPAVQEDSGVTVHRIRQLRDGWGDLASRDSIRHPPPYPDPVMAWGLRRLVRRFRPDVVHSQGWISYSAAAALLGLRTPLLVSARDYGYFCANRTLLRDDTPCSGPSLGKCLPCAGRYYGRPKGWIAVAGVSFWQPLLRHKVSAVHNISTFVDRTMRTNFFHNGKRECSTPDIVIPSFLADDENGNGNGNVAAHLELLPREPFILYVGQFRRVKGLEILFRAYERLESPPPLVVIGEPHDDGPPEIPSYVKVMTAWPHSAVMAAYDRASFAVMPSLWPEPLGSVVHEAMSRGKPVIGTNHGGHTDMIVNEETGLLVPPGDVDALVEAMQRLNAEPDLRARMGEAARERSRLFKASAALPRFAQLYSELASHATPITAV